LKDLQWIPNALGSKSKQSSKAWEFMGNIVVKGSGDAIDQMLYCKFCFDEQLANKGMLIKVYSTGPTTASGNHLAHASSKHDITFQKSQDAKITDWLSKTNLSSPATTQFEFNRDLVVLMCRDLQPFSMVERKGFAEFCNKNIASFQMPSATTVSTTALIDVYNVIKCKLLEVLSEINAGTLMMDGWTDKYKKLPYFAVRLSAIHDWSFKVFTLSIAPVDSHTAESLASFLKTVLREFLPQQKKIMLFNTTDAAANMKKLSKLLGHDRINCVAHSLHLLLTTDSLFKVPELCRLVASCKEIIKTLHFKGHLMAEFQIKEEDASLYEKIALIQEQLIQDKDSAVNIENTDGFIDADPVPLTVPSDAAANCTRANHVHSSLKMDVPTRWNYTLTMIESLLDLQKPAEAILKQIGKSTMWLDSEDIELLEELKLFLTPFREFTLLMSECAPNLSVVPLMVTKIKSICMNRVNDAKKILDSEPMIKLKKIVREAVEKRLVTDKLVKLACCFDPAVRNAVLSANETRTILQQTYTDLCKSRYDSSVFDSCNDEELEVGESSTAKNLRLSLIQETAANSQHSAANPLQQEINHYLALNDESSALEFWKRYEKSFPILSAMARVYLCVSAGSVPVESLFSTAGLILNSRRSSLAPYRMNMVCFVHDNYDLL
jgi:hypothetical protein